MPQLPGRWALALQASWRALDRPTRSFRCHRGATGRIGAADRRHASRTHRMAHSFESGGSESAVRAPAARFRPAARESIPSRPRARESRPQADRGAVPADQAGLRARGRAPSADGEETGPSRASTASPKMTTKTRPSALMRRGRRTPCASLASWSGGDGSTNCSSMSRSRARCAQAGFYRCEPDPFHDTSRGVVAIFAPPSASLAAEGTA